MIIGNLKLVLRNMAKQKTYSAIIIIGLAIGMACSTLIFLWVSDELSYDRFHQNAENLYIATFSNGSTTTPPTLSTHLASEYPEVQYSSRCSFDNAYLLNHGDQKARQNGGVMVDPSFLKMFTLPFLKGNPDNALANPHSIVISQELADFYFGQEDPLGKTIEWGGTLDLTVTGVMENYPQNSEFHFRYLLPLSLAQEQGYKLDNWDVNFLRTFVQLKENIQADQVDKKILNVVERHVPTDKRTLFLQPITKLHLYDLPREGGLISYVYAFSLMATLILIIACINFMNLSTARSAKRALEVGIRKTIGARRVDLFRQFLGESILFTFFALLIAVFLVFLTLPLFNNITGKQLSGHSLLNTHFFIWILAVTGVTGFISGSYPSLYLSHFQPVSVLKGKLRAGVKNSILRKVLVVTQFTISVFLIIGSLIMLNQIDYMKNKDRGIDTDHVIYVSVGNELIKDYAYFKNELKKNPDITNMTLTSCAPYYWNMNAGLGSVKWQGQTTQQTKMVMTSVDEDYLDTFHLKVTDGRFFSTSFGTDATEAYVVNQAAVRAMEMDDPIGKELTIFEKKGTIIGVVQDYNFESLHSSIIPMAMQMIPERYSTLCVRINQQRLTEAIAFIKETYMELFPKQIFGARFLNDAMAMQYKSEENVAILFKYFTFLAIFISCLGLFGLANFTAEQRKKEIGIRKVLGSSHARLLILLTKEFVKWVLLSNFIAGPIAWYFMNKWLSGFAYRIDMPLQVFGIACALSIVIAMATVGVQTLKATLQNPVNSLKCE